ncbi:MAG: hypothetical protein IIA61_01345 [Candidatus Marinimicrobia bacterium]|nr:hypothetical protein [Candidatus Neomarinimicrobiota bacterium]
MKIKYLVVICAWFPCQFLFADKGKDVAIEIVIQNQVRQTLDNVVLDYLIPNGLGLNLHRKDWTASILYGYNSYFFQKPAINVGVFKETNTILGNIGILTSLNPVVGIEHYFYDSVHNKDLQKVLKQSFNYLMTEIGILGRKYTLHRMVGLEGSIRLGIIYELSGLADITKYGRTPLKLWINIGSLRPGISWDYIVHDSMEGWDVDNIKLIVEYIL